MRSTSLLRMTVVSLLVLGGSSSARPQSAPPTPSDEALATARTAIRDAHYAQAVDMLKRDVKQFPSDSRFQVELGKAYLYEKQDGPAISQFRKVLAAQPTHRAAKLELARALAYQAKFPESDKLYRELLSADQADETASLGLIRNLLHQRRPGEAREQLRRALMFHPNSLRLNEYRDQLEEKTGAPKAGLRERTPRSTRGNDVQAWTFFTHDSAGNQAVEGFQRLDYSVAPKALSRFDFSERAVSSSRLENSGMSVLSGLGQMQFQITPSIRIAGGAGVLGFSDGFSRALYRGSLDYHPSKQLWFAVSASRYGITPTTTAAAFHITAQGVQARTEWLPSHWRIRAELSRDYYSDGVIRNEQSLEVLRWLGSPRFGVAAGYGFRHLAFDDNLGHGYFSPNQYQQHMAITGIRFAVAKAFRAEYLTRVGAESLVAGSYRPAYEFGLRNHFFVVNRWEITADYFYYHLAQSSGAFVAQVGQLGVKYRF